MAKPTTPILILTCGAPIAPETRLARIVAEAAAARIAANIHAHDINASALPLYKSSKLPVTIPRQVQNLNAMLGAHAAWILAVEEAFGLPALEMQNALLWLAQASAHPFNKVISLVSLDRATLDGCSGLGVLSRVLSDLGGLIVPPLVIASDNDNMFAADGSLQDQFLQQRLETAGYELARILQTFGSTRHEV